LVAVVDSISSARMEILMALAAAQAESLPAGQALMDHMNFCQEENLVRPVVQADRQWFQVQLH
jgi:hypothetical protein